MSGYPTLKTILTEDCLKALKNPQQLNLLIKNLQNDIRQMRRSMSALPTSKEMDSLPHLKVLNTLTSQISLNKKHPFNTLIKNNQIINEMVIRDLFTFISHSVIKTRIYNNKEIVKIADELFMKLVKWGSMNLYMKNVYSLEMLNVIINSSAEYYKTNGKESAHLYPFGEKLEMSEEHTQWVDELENGDRVDCLNSASNKKCWAVAEIINKDWNSVKVRYVNNNKESYIYNKYFEFMKVGTRKEYYDWRMELKVGDNVDFYSYKENWKGFVVKEVFNDQNEFGERLMKVKIEELEKSDKDEDIKSSITNVLSPKLKKFKKFSERNTEFDDYEDFLYLETQKEKKYAIMRSISGHQGGSIYIVKYMNIFGDKKGFDFILNVLENKEQVPQEILGYLIQLIQSCCKNLVKPFIDEHGAKILENIKKYLLVNTKENLRDLNKNNITTVLNAVSSLADRVYSEKKSKKLTLELEIDIALICIKSKFLDKQFYGAKLFNVLETKIRDYSSKISKEEFAEILKKEEVFEIIIKGHHSLIAKGNGVLKILFSQNCVSKDQLDVLWNQICKSDFETQTALLIVIKDILWDFSKEEIIFFINKMIENSEDIINQELFDLLFSLKKVGWNRYSEFAVVEKVNKVLWGILQNKKEIKKDLIDDVMKNFIKFIEENKCDDYLEKIIDNIKKDFNNVRNLKILGKLVKLDNEVTQKVFGLIQSKNLIHKLIDDILKIIGSKIEENDLKKDFSQDNRIELERIFKFINNVMKFGKDIELLKFKEIKRIWEIVFEANLDNKFILDWIRNYINQPFKESLIEEYISFFNENIDKFSKNNKEGFFCLFILLFYRINMSKKNFLTKKLKLETAGIVSYNSKTTNIYLLNNKIKNLIGFQKIWSLYLEIDDLNLEDNISEFLSIIYLKPLFENKISEFYKIEKENIFAECRDMVLSSDIKKARKGTRLLDKLIKREESKGFKDLKTFFALKEMPKIIITIEKDVSYSKDKFSTSIKQNKTIGFLRKKIQNAYKMKFESIEIRLESPNGKEITHYQNSLTLNQLDLKKKTNLIIKEKELPEVEEELILTSDGEDFSQKAKLVFNEIFQKFSEDGKMRRSDLARFTTEATDGTLCTIHDDRIGYVFNSYDKDKKNFLSVEEFTIFFYDCASKSSSKLHTVKQNLQSLGYDKSLKLKKNLKNENLVENVENTFRYFLAKDDEFFKMIESLVNKDDYFKDFMKFITPNFNFLKNLVQNPEIILKNSIDSDFSWNYNLVLIETSVFNSKYIGKILNYIDFDFNNEIKKSLILKIFTKSFFTILFNKIKNSNTKTENFLKESFSLFVFLEKILKIAVSFKEKEYIEDTTNFIAFKIKQKKKNKEKALKKLEQESKKKETSTQTDKNKVIIGPALNPEKNDKKNKKIDEEEKKLKKIKELLIKDEQLISDFLKDLPFEEINTKCLNILNILLDLKPDLLTQTNKSLLKSILVILLSSLITSPEKLTNLLKNEKSIFKKILFKGLTHKSTIIQFYFKSFYAYLTANIGDQNLKTTFLRLIIKNIKSSSDNEEMHVMIELASNLLKEIGTIKNEEHSDFDLDNLFKEFSHKLISYQTKEIDFETEEDNTLISILTFMEKIVEADSLVLKNYPEVEKRKLIQFIFKESLFNVTSQNINLEKINCKTGRSRSKALELLKLLVKDDIKSTIFLFIKGYQPLSKHIPELNYNSKSSVKRNKLNYIGIKNPGCVCYMNAMLQQFYCTPPFRYGILMANDGVENVPFLENDQMVLDDDNVFHQFQKMFAYLDSSQRGDFSPREFCKSYKDFSGQRVNLMVQQDAQEFLNMIFDKLEKALMPTPFKGILDSVFAGKTANVFTCKNCGFVRSNEELFYNLSLEVKNFENINDSFNKFIKMETISDYNCDNCKKKCDITKQCFLKELPNVLIIHLQKISFDLEALRNIKYSSRYEFGKTLDLKKFLKPKDKLPENVNENEDEKEKEKKIKEDEDCEYRLVGVVIHNGNAEYGHYTSLINVNREDPNREELKNDLWLEFDDSRISKYNMNNFSDDCFGSKKKEEYPGLIEMDVSTSKSAYILVYDKVKNLNLKFHFNEKNINEKDKLIQNLVDPTNFKFKDNNLETDYYNLKKYIPEKYQKMINIDNRNLVLENQLLGGKFTNTLAEIIAQSGCPYLNLDKDLKYEANSYEKSLSDLYLKILPDYLFKIFCVSNENYKIRILVNAIETALIIKNDKINSFFEDYIYQTFNFLCNLLINNTDSLIRKATGDFFVNVLTLTYKKNNFNLFYTQDKNVHEMIDLERTQFFFIQTIDNLLNIIPNENQNSGYKKMDNFFETIRRLCEKNEDFLQYLLQKNILHRIFDLFMVLNNNKTNAHEKSLTHLISLIALLLNKLKKGMITSNNGNKKKLKDYFSFFLNAKFVCKIMREDYKFNNYEGLHEIIKVVCENNLSLSRQIIYLALRELLKSNENESIGFLEGFHALLSINDQFTEKRVKMILGSPKLVDTTYTSKNRTLYSYGINKENSLKRAKYLYLSTFGFEKGLIEQLINGKETSEAVSLMMIYYLLTFCEMNPFILDYVLFLQPFNYLHSSLVDWFRGYCDYQLKVLPSSYSPPSAELFYLFFNNLPEKLSNFEKISKEYLIQKNYLTEQAAIDYKIFSQNNEELKNVKQQYMIGQTLSKKLIKEKILFQDEFGDLKITLNLIKVSLMPLRSNGQNNLNFPKESLSFESYINKTDIDEELQNFIGKEIEEENNYNLDIDEDSPSSEQRPITEKNASQVKEKIEKELSENSLYFNKDYILRISVSNSSYKNFYVKILIENKKEYKKNYEDGEWIRFMKSNKENVLFKNLTLDDVSKGFEGLVVKACFAETEQTNIMFFEEEELGPLVLINEFN